MSLTWGSQYQIKENKSDWTSNRIQPIAEFKVPERSEQKIIGYEDLYGRNLYRNIRSDYFAGSNIITIVGENEIRVDFSTNIERPTVQLRALDALDISKTYTLSFYVTLLRESEQTLSFGLHGTGEPDQGIVLEPDVKTKITHTFSPSISGSSRLFLYTALTTVLQSLHVEEVKVEEGTVATPFVPEVTDAGGENAYKQKYMNQLTEGQLIPESWISYPLGIFLVATPKKKETGAIVTREIEAYDKLLILKEDKITDRTLFKKNNTYYSSMVSVFESAGINKYNFENDGKRLMVDKEYEPGTEKLAILNDLASDLNFTQFWVDEFGYFRSGKYLAPSERSVDYEYIEGEMSINVIGMEEELDLFNLPNVFYMTVTNPDMQSPLSATSINDNANHPRSIPSLGRRVVSYEEKDDIADKEALQAYIDRVAYETSQIFGKVTFSTAFMPFHSYSNILWIQNKTLGIDGKYSETDWTIDLEPGADMIHVARRTIKLT